MTQAKEIFNQYGIGKFMMGDVAGKAKVIAAINEALNLNADKVKNLEEENKRLRELGSKQKEYTQLLSDELSEVVSMVAVHGWRSSRYEQGKLFRDEIEKLENEIQYSNTATPKV